MYSVSEKGVGENGEIKINENTYVVTQEGNNITNTFKPPTGNIEATKVWVNGNDANRPTVYFKLFRQIGDGDLVAVPDAEIKTLAHGTTTVSWNVATQDESGVNYIFTVREFKDAEGNSEGPPTNYEVSYDGLKVTNTYKPSLSDLEFTKIWEGGKAPRPTVYFKLFRTTSETIAPVAVEDAEIKAIADGESTATWNNMPRTNQYGVNYIYSIKEFKDAEGSDEGAPENYTVDYSTGFRTVKNIYIIPKGNITLIKEWIGGPNEIPDTWFTLSRSLDGENFENLPNSTIKVVENKVTWEYVDLTDINGNEYKFKPFESNADGYPWVPANYQVEIEELDQKFYYQATNRYSLIELLKIWDISTLDKDYDKLQYPILLFKLFRSTDKILWEAVPDAELMEIDGNNTVATWSGLSMYN